MMKVEKEYRWAITAGFYNVPDRRIMDWTISRTRSDAITKALVDNKHIHKHSRGRRAKWDRMKRHKLQFRVERIVIAVLGS